jgi:hypothetical protein
VERQGVARARWTLGPLAGPPGLGYASESMVSGGAIDQSDGSGWTARVPSSFDLVEWPVGSQTGQRTLTGCVTLEYSGEPICYGRDFNVVA